MSVPTDRPPVLRARTAAALAGALLLLVPAAGRCETAGTHLGAEFSLAETTPIAEIAAHPSVYFNRDVRIEGVVASVDTMDGSFIEVVPEKGGEGILVSLHEPGDRFPSDCVGARAVVEGMFYRKVYPASRVSRWQKRSFHAGARVPDFALVSRMSAEAVEIAGERVRPPAPHDIEPARTDRLDLASMEFETDGFGTGRKVLAPGDSTETHSTEDAREIIICLEGTITAIRDGRGATELHAGEMTYIEPNTRHAIYNRSTRPATYVFVYSTAVPRQPEADER